MADRVLRVVRPVLDQAPALEVQRSASANRPERAYQSTARDSPVLGSSVQVRCPWMVGRMRASPPSMSPSSAMSRASRSASQVAQSESELRALVRHVVAKCSMVSRSAVSRARRSWNLAAGWSD